MTSPIAIADHLAAGAAGAVSVVGAAAFAAGQVPVPSWIPAEVIWLSVTFGPAAIWSVLYGRKMKLAYHRTRRVRAESRAQRLLDVGRSLDDDEVEEHLDQADHHASWEAVLGTQPDSPPRIAASRRNR